MEKNFIKGAFFKEPNPNAPDFIKGQISVKCQDFEDYMRANNTNGWLNIDIKQSKEGKIYLELNTFVPKPKSN